MEDYGCTRYRTVYDSPVAEVAREYLYAGWQLAGWRSMSSQRDNTVPLAQQFLYKNRTDRTGRTRDQARPLAHIPLPLMASSDNRVLSIA